MLDRLWKFNGGVHPPQNKSQSLTEAIVPAPLPERLILPLHQHIGAPAETLVKVGDTVLKGQCIAKASGYVSAAIHAPTSGKIVNITELPVPHPSGLSAPCLVLESDGEEKWTELQPHEDDYQETDPSHLRNLIREAGIVGLGGAGFPTFIKLNPGPNNVIDTLILNGIECEPYITCDDMLMRNRPEEIIAGAKILRHALQAHECVIAIEDNKPGAIETLTEAANGHDIKVVPIPTIYPAGSEKQLIQVITGKEVPSNGLPVHVGVVLQNVGTTVAVHRAINLGEPLISRIVTITGNGVNQGRNIETLIGTPIHDLIRYCGGQHEEIEQLIMGGPMMGYLLYSDAVPVIKTTNCIIAGAAGELNPRRETLPCIRCGSCAQACPIQLLPQQLYWYSRAKEFDKAQEYNLFDCIECGCCDYVCPSQIPLVQYYRYAKGEIWTREREKKKADIARQRHEFRQQRQEREKAERAQRHKRKKAALKDDAGNAPKNAPQQDQKKQAILDAIERVEKKKTAKAAPDEPKSAANENAAEPKDTNIKDQSNP